VAPDTILIQRSPGETRYALMAGETLIEVVHRRDGDVQPGSLYAGRAGARVPGVSAIFVEIGAALPGVLPVKSVVPPQGAALAVTVVVPPRDGKGPELKPVDMAVPERKAPALLRASDEPVLAWWQCYRDGIAQIICAPRREATRIKALLDPAAPVESSEADLFAAHGVDAAIEAGLEPAVMLPSGGSIVIESTAAVVAIDVNSGAGDPGTANSEAMIAVAAELRRRNISGHIVVDIIPTRRRGTLPHRLADALSPDPIPTNIAGLTPLGMIELTRKRIGLSLAEVLCEANGAPRATTVACRLLRAAVSFALAEHAGEVQAAASPEVVALLQGPMRAALDEARGAIKGDISVLPRGDFPRAKFDIRRP
jgi:Ribonuclease G/E